VRRGGAPECHGEVFGLRPLAQRGGGGLQRKLGKVLLDHLAIDRRIQHGQHVICRRQEPVVVFEQQGDIAVVAVGVGNEKAKSFQEAQLRGVVRRQ